VPGTPKQKQKTLCLLRILYEKTDREHALTLAELSSELKKYGISSERKSLYRDLAAISEAGFAIGTVRSKDTRYFWEDRPLSFGDLRLLSHSLRISSAVPRKRKPELDKKLQDLMPVSGRRGYFAEDLTVIGERSVTERAYSSVEVLSLAIRSGKQVRFCYRASALRDLSSGRRSSVRVQTVSPYRLVWNNAYFLVAADSEGGLNFYHVDRISELVTTEIPVADIREVGGDLDFDLNQYIKGSFSVLEDPVRMVFRVSAAFLSTAERHFPADAEVESDGGGRYLLTCDALADEALFGWLLLHYDDIRLIAPESLVLRLQSLARGANRAYEVADISAESGINFEETGKTVDKFKKVGYNK
jgi:predicted DNA-binding transcriptional regulator YafY